jgi:hypothetical protein
MELAGFRGVGEILHSGVYALVWRGQVVYIGKSKKMLARIYTHKLMVGKSKSMFTSAVGVRFDDIFVCPCPIEKLDELEKEMINLYKPRYNIHLKSPHFIDQEIPLTIRGITITLNAPQTNGPRPQIERRI